MRGEARHTGFGLNGKVDPRASVAAWHVTSIEMAFGMEPFRHDYFPEAFLAGEKMTLDGSSGHG